MNTEKNETPIFYLQEIIEHHHFNPSSLNGLEAESLTLSEGLSPKQVTILENLIRSVIQEVLEIEVNSYIRSILSRNSQLSNQIGKEGIGKLKKLKLIFINQTAPTIFTNNEIEAKNGKPLLVAICDTTNSNAIIKTGSLSSALVELVVLNGDFGSDLQRQQISWSWSDFNKNIVSKRVGKRPLIVGNDMIVCLKDGVGFIKGLSFSDNSSWTKSKKFRLGAKVVDQEILAKFPRIQEAVSQPFRVMDHRGEVYKKHHPPIRTDEIWRLEGIGKDGVYHNRLSSNEIKTVGHFLKVYYQKGPTYLKKLLGEKVPQNTWKKMISNALECDLVGNEANFNKSLEVGEEMNLSESDGELHQHFPSFNPTSRVPLTHVLKGFFVDSIKLKQNLKDMDLEVVHHQFGAQLQHLLPNPPTLQEHLGENYEAMRGQGFEGIGEQDNHFIFYDDYPPLLPQEEASSTSYNHNHKGRPWTGLVPKPK